MKRNTHRRPLARTALMLALLSVASLAQAQTINPQAIVNSGPTGAVTGRAPVLASADITFSATGQSGDLVVGDTLTATYVQTDPDLDPADVAATEATIQWQADGVDIAGATGMTYQIRAADAGKGIGFTLVPTTDSATTDPYVGVRTASSAVSPGEGDGVVTVPGTDNLVSITITGSAIVDSTLTAVPACMTTCAAVDYQWQIEDAVGSGNYVDIAGATNGTYVVKRDEQKRKIQVVARNP
ncbi:ZirU family protein [Pseudoxanthomonas sp. UTMC 1351]|uniref:ZirU family protein n=1 Tax=Pseudoxanthomonas sp. UTMC 1351 TaxID=2695853 RepID=UPI0034CF58B3